MSEPATIMITRPLKAKDPTQYTYEWGKEAIEIAEDLGYKIVDIAKEKTTYEYVSESIKKYKPSLFLHLGHGCSSTLQGINNCIINRKFSIDELLSMVDDVNRCHELNKMYYPLKSCNPQLCSCENDPCAPNCYYPTNIDLLKGTIVYAIACHSQSKLGKCAPRYGVKSYIGFDQLLMFPVDRKNSQDIFKDVLLTLYRNLLLGTTVEEANREMNMIEDYNIKKYKKIKYLALPLLWNKLHRKITGNVKSTIYD